MSQLDELKKMTTVVADTGDFATMEHYLPQDATTNPSLILLAIQEKKYRPLAERATGAAKKQASSQKEYVQLAADHLLINFGKEILSIVPGRVSTEVDARLSFDVAASIAKAHHLIGLYKEAGVPKERVLIKLASTWEGMEAATELEREGIHCNMTLMFCLPQAVAAANAKATLISPFVGRIYDWYKKNDPGKEYTLDTDPGVQSVRSIYSYYKKFGIATEVMGASFRNRDQILGLAGCDLLTISPSLLQELQDSSDPVVKKLSKKDAVHAAVERIAIDEAKFRFLLNEDPMAVSKLSEGIRRFAKDNCKLEEFLLQNYPMH